MSWTTPAAAVTLEGYDSEALIFDLVELGYSPNLERDEWIDAGEFGRGFPVGRIEFGDSALTVHRLSSAGVLLWSARFTNSPAVPVAIVLATAAAAAAA